MYVRFNSLSPLKEQLTKVLAENPEESTLDFTDNQLGVVEQNELCEMLCLLKEDRHIKHLILSGTGLQYKSGAELNELMSCLQDTEITSIDLTNNFFGLHKSVDELNQLLSGFNNTNIKEVNFNHNHLERLDQGKLKRVFSDYNGLKIFSNPKNDNLAILPKPKNPNSLFFSSKETCDKKSTVLHTSPPDPSR